MIFPNSLAWNTDLTLSCTNEEEEEEEEGGKEERWFRIALSAKMIITGPDLTDEQGGEDMI